MYSSDWFRRVTDESRSGDDYKARFYKLYQSTHVRHRKGLATLELFQRQAPGWRRLFGPLLPAAPDAAIVDVGCGSGSLLWWLQQMGYRRAEGIDVSPEQVELAAQLGVRNVRQADLREFLSAHGERFDAVILRDVIEHFDRPTVLDVLRLCRSALRPGGRIVLQVPNAESPFFGRIRYGDFTHELAFSVSSLEQLLAVCGFESVQCHPTPPLVASLRSAARLPLWWMVQALYHLLLFAELGRGHRRIVTQGIIAVGERPLSGVR